MLMKTINYDTTQKKCYVCGIDLEVQKIQTRDTNENQQYYEFPTMTLWNGKKKELCGSCYKNHIHGIKIFKENNPNWQYPQ